MAEPKYNKTRTDGTATVWMTAEDAPSNREAEEACLGCIIIDPDCYSTVSGIIRPEDFHLDRHGFIFDACGRLAERGEHIDYVMLEAELKRRKQLDDVGGAAYLTELMNRAPSILHVESYARLVKESADRRVLLSQAGEIANLAIDQTRTPDQIAARMAEMLNQRTSHGQERYTVRDMDYILQPLPPVKWMVDGLIYDKSVTVLYGDGGTKKTWSLIYLAACIASGQKWGDFETTKTRVLFVDEENGDDEMRTRTQFCKRGALAGDDIPLKYISLAAFHLDDALDEAVLTNEIRSQDAGLVIIDALADIMLGDENDKKDTQPVFNAFRRIAERTGAAIIVIHHAGKSGTFRGSSVIKDAPDILLKVESDMDSPFINFRTEKNRRGKALKWAMRATWTADQFYLQAGEAQERQKVLSKSQEYVLRYLAEHGPSPLPDIMGSADTCTDGAARQAVYSLTKDGRTRRTNPGGKPAIYELVKPEESL